MRLRHIEVFHAVMQAGTVSGAAQMLHISQPAVTKVLQHCELQLGLPLFERIRGKLYPKPEAHRLFVETEKLARELIAIRRVAAALKTRSVETIRVAAAPSLALSLLPNAMAMWRRDFAHTQCELSTHHTADIVDALRVGEMDMGLSLNDPRHPSIVAEPLAEGPLVAMRSARDWGVEFHGQPIAHTALPPDLIGLSLTDPMGARVAELFEVANFQPEYKTTVQTYILARALAESGAGTALVDPFTAAQPLPQRMLVARPLAPAVTVRLYLLSASNSPLSHSARELVKAIAAAAHRCLDDLSQAPLARKLIGARAPAPG